MAIRDGVDFFYFGNGCIADYYGNTIAYLNEIDIKIIKLCLEDYSKADIIQQVSKENNENEIKKRINNLYKKGIIIYSNTMPKRKTCFFGKKGLYFPKEIAIELTNTCNYACPFCYKNAKVKGEFITEDNILKVDRLIRNNVRNILLTGGEPTIHPKYLNYIELFSQYAKVHMISNGSLLFEHNPSTLKKLDRIQFTIYGCDNEEYKKMTGMQDGFTRLCKSVDFAKKNEINISAGITLCDETIDHMEKFVQIAIALEFKDLRIGVADVFGRGKYLFGEDSNYEEQRHKAYDMLLELKRKYRKQISFELPNINTEHVTPHDDIINNVYRCSLKCGCGSEYLVVSQSGKVRPCQMLPERWFSINSENALWEHIHGDFHIGQLSEAIKNYYRENNFETLNISPCQALEYFVSSKEGNHE